MKQNTDTAQHIIEIGTALIAKKGFSAVGLAEILKTANVPKGSFYHYFASKEQFGQAILENYFSSYINRLSILLQEKRLSVAERLLAYWQRWQSIEQNESGCLVVKLSAEVADLSEAMRSTLHQGCLRILTLLQDTIIQGQINGELPTTIKGQQLAAHLYYLWLGACLADRLARDGKSLALATQQTKWLLGQKAE